MNKENDNVADAYADMPDIIEYEKKQTTIKDILLFILRIAIAAGIIIWMVWRHQESLLNALKGFNYIWLLPAAFCYAIHLFAGAWRWYILLHLQKIQITFFESLSLSMQGFFFSLVLPGGAIGGDVVKAAFLVKRTPKGNKLTGTFTILIDRIIGMISLFTLAGIAGLASYKFLSSVSGFMTLIVYALLLGCIIGLGSAVVLFFHRQLEKFPGVAPVLKLGDRLTHGAVSKLTDAMDSFRNAWRSLLVAILISIIGIHLLLSVVVYCVAQGLGAGNYPSETYVLATTLANATAAIPATPSGVGTRDIVMQKIFVAAGIPSGDAVAIALIFTSIILIFNLSGGLFFIFSKSHRSPIISQSNDH